MATENEPTSKLDTVCSVKFTYTDGGRWHSIDVDCREQLRILQEGTVDGKQICAVEVFTVVNQDEEVVRYVYDFVLQATGQNPWRLA